MPIQCQYRANTMLIQCQYSANAMENLWLIIQYVLVLRKAAWYYWSWFVFVEGNNEAITSSFNIEMEGALSIISFLLGML